MAPRIWLVTGASTGLGEALALKVLAAGDKVIATSRSVIRLKHLAEKGAATIALDQNQPLPEIKRVIEAALAVDGEIDVLVSNAAYVQGGTIEETSCVL